jgi:hypothetical protein
METTGEQLNIKSPKLALMLLLNPLWPLSQPDTTLIMLEPPSRYGQYEVIDGRTIFEALKCRSKLQVLEIRWDVGILNNEMYCSGFGAFSTKFKRTGFWI